MYSLPFPCPFSRRADVFFLFFFFFLELFLVEWEEKLAWPKNKSSIALGRLVHLFPTLHNIPLGGLRTLFLLTLLALPLFLLFGFFFFFYLCFPRIPAGYPFKTAISVETHRLVPPGNQDLYLGDKSLTTAR